MRRSVGAVGLLLAVALLAGGACGRKTAVRPPDLIAPETVRALSVTNTTNGIELRWERPTRYVDRSQMLDLAGFRIERRRACCGFRLIHQIEVDDRERFRRAKTFSWTDPEVDIGEIYYYQVIAYTLDEDLSAPAGPIEIKRILEVSGDPPAAPE